MSIVETTSSLRQQHQIVPNVQFGEYMGLLSANVVQQLKSEDPSLRSMWDSILQRAYILERVREFDHGILSRSKEFSVFEIAFIPCFQEIFASSCEVVDVFLKLASTRTPIYYSREVFLRLLALFREFHKICSKADLPKSVDEVPCFDQGGEEWITAEIQKATLVPQSDCISRLAVEKLDQGRQKLSQATTDVNSEVSVINCLILAGDQFFRGATCAVSLFWDSIPLFAHRPLSTEKFVQEKIGVYNIDPVHVSRIIQICEQLFGREANDAAIPDIDALVFLIAKIKATIGMNFFLLISQAESYAQGNLSFGDVLLMLQLFCQLNDFGKIDNEAIEVAKEFYVCSRTVPQVIQKVRELSHKAEELSKDPFVEKGFSDPSFTDSECYRIEGVLRAMRWMKEEGVKSEKDVLEELKSLKSHLDGDEFFMLLYSVSFQHVHNLTALYRVLHQIKIMVGMGGKIEDLVRQFSDGRISIVRLDDELEKKKVAMSEAKSPEKDLGEIAQQMDPETRTMIGSVFEDYREVYSFGQPLRSLRVDGIIQKVEEIKGIARKRPLSRSESNTLLALAREAIRKEFGIYPYNTQIITALGLLSPSANIRGKIAQVKTGEGKSTIIALLAFYQAVLGKTVDIISSSRYLAMRDEQKYHPFFATYGISTSHVCTDTPTKKNFLGQILFSTNFDLEWAVMHDYFRKQPMRTIECDGAIIKRPFEVVIVDEVDNLFIDSALNSARISIPGTEEETAVYSPLFHYVQDNLDVVDQFISGGCKDPTIIAQLQKVITTEAPSLSNQKLKMLVESAFRALHLRKNEDYVVKPIVRGEDRKDEIVIVDKNNTGRLAEKSRWQHGLHQFLELLNYLPVTGESLLISSLCHPVFFSSYEKIFGLTGTIGIDVEVDEIREMYDVESFKIPPHRANRREDLPSIACRTKSEYGDALIHEILEMKRTQRPTLILVETIDESGKMVTLCKEHSIDCQILNARQTTDEDFLIAKAGMPGSVTIATNTAGRGTDIVLAPDSISHGGLHVIFGYMPANDRVEMQGFGRAGRQGQPGSARMIILVEQSLLRGLEELGYTPSSVDHIEYLMLRKVRDYRIETLSASNRLRARIEKINHEFLQKFVGQFIVWQKMAYRSVPRTVIDETEEEAKKQFASHFYNKLDELWDSVFGSEANPTSIQKKYEAEIGKLFASTKQFWEASFSRALSST
jgi:preprotein translocase subunit SecA